MMRIIRKIAKKILKIAYRLFLFVFLFVVLMPLAVGCGVYRCFQKRPVMPRRVFIGGAEIANNIGSLQNALENNGIMVRTLKSHDNFFYSECSAPHGRRWLGLQKRFDRFVNLIWALAIADQVWLIWHESFLRYNLDYVLFKISKVDFVVMHCGDDVRCRHLHDFIFEKYAPNSKLFGYVPNRKKDIIQKFYRQWMGETFAKVVSSRHQSTFQISPIGRAYYCQPELLAKPKEANDIPVLLHAPSNRQTKKTVIVLQAIKILHDKGLDFTFVLLEQVKNKHVLEQLLATDILIDQPTAWTGRLGVEAAASSCAVISGNNYEFMAYPSSPFMEFPPDATRLAETIEILLLDHSLLNEKKVASWQYWKENYSEEAFMLFYKAIWDNSYPKFSPLIDQKKLLLSGATDRFERLLIKVLYHPCE